MAVRADSEAERNLPDRIGGSSAGPGAGSLSDIPLSRRINSATTVLPAVAGFVVVHRAVLAAFLAALRRGLSRKRACANSCRQNRKQNFRVRLHTLNLLREMN